MEPNGHKDESGLDLEAMRVRLAGKTGKRYWRSLEELSETPEFQKFLDDEFPNRATLNQINRRDLIKYMGASLALAGLGGCRGVFLPEDKVVPYVKQPEEMVPGMPLYYASSVVLGGYGTGVLVEQREGRPITIQGNPEHPASLGSLDVMSQAEILSLYDPDRPTVPTLNGDLSTWPNFEEVVHEFLKSTGNGQGVRVLTGNVTSPTFAGLMTRLLAKYPAAKWHAYEPVGLDGVNEAANLVLGRPANITYDFSKAKVVLSLDSDFFSAAENPGSVRYAREFVNGRRVQGKTGEMNRLYALESTPGLVGVLADHRWPMRAVDIYPIAQALAASVGVEGASNPNSPILKQAGRYLPGIVADLKANAGACVVIAGSHQPMAVHALALMINSALGNIGTTVKPIDPVSATIPGKVESLKELVADMASGQVQGLFIIDSNPVYNAPVDLPFVDALQKVKVKVQLGGNADETSEYMDWHLPLSHTLEAWGDVRAFDGTASIVQPLLAPLFDSRSAIEFVSILLAEGKDGYQLVRGQWNGSLLGDFEKSWRKVVHDGVIPNTVPQSAATPGGKLPPGFSLASLPPAPTGGGLEVVFRPDPSIYDGRFANNGWLQELPKPLTKITWDNVITISPSTALSLNVVSDDMVELNLNGRMIQAPVFVQPGNADDSITIHLGFGRTAGGTVASLGTEEGTKERDGGGFNAYGLRTSSSMGYALGASLTPLGYQREIASTQGHSPLNGDRILDDRDVIRDVTLAEFLQKASGTGDDVLAPPGAPTAEWIRKQNLFVEEVFQWDGPQWGMTIDMNTCIGCNACVIACQAENNIPVVGKEQVARHREMHWLRIDRYYSGDETNGNPQVTWQPLMCVHCEKAPCEPVCPVAATVHSHEGLNQMIYNRCVGTRYCSNNCPYKVRRFNFFNYSDNQPNFSGRVGDGFFNQSRIPGPLHAAREDGIEMLRMLSNPDVSVRGRGVMEKCTYCVQRINYARIEAKKAGRDIRDGEIVTACQQACPTQTIVFGNIADKNSAVSHWRGDPRGYRLLEELQTRPRTVHLAKLRNPNPEIKA